MDKDAMITYLIGELKKENLELHDLIIPEELEEKQKLLRALFNTRKPMAASTQFLTIQDLYLQVRKGERGFVNSVHSSLSHKMIESTSGRGILQDLK